MRLRSVFVQCAQPAAPGAQSGYLVDLDDLLANSREITTYTPNQLGNRSLFLPRPSSAPFHYEQQVNCLLHLSEIPRTFRVRTYNDDQGKTPAAFDENNCHSITLYFDHATHDKFHG
jgi:hypothetical protein